MKTHELTVRVDEIDEEGKYVYLTTELVTLSERKTTSFGQEICVVGDELKQEIDLNDS